MRMLHAGTNFNKLKKLAAKLRSELKNQARDSAFTPCLKARLSLGNFKERLATHSKAKVLAMYAGKAKTPAK